MKYLLDEIADYITAELSLTNVFVNFTPSNTSNANNSNNDMVVIESEGGVDNADVLTVQNIAIYVRNSNRKLARQNCEAIEQLLTQFKGYLTLSGARNFINYIQITTKTQPFGVAGNFDSEFITRIRVDFQNKSAKNQAVISL